MTKQVSAVILSVTYLLFTTYTALAETYFYETKNWTMDTSEPSPPPPREHTYDILGTYMRKKYIEMAKNSTPDEVREAMQRRNYSQHDIDSVLRTASNRCFFRRFLCGGDAKIEK
jgi:hypothetical protein